MLIGADIDQLNATIAAFRRSSTELNDALQRSLRAIQSMQSSQWSGQHRQQAETIWDRIQAQFASAINDLENLTARTERFANNLMEAGQRFGDSANISQGNTINQGITPNQGITQPDGSTSEVKSAPDSIGQNPQQDVPSTPIPLRDGVSPQQFSPNDGCVRYAQTRRPDLGIAPGAGGAADYIHASHLKDKIFQLTTGSERIDRGYAIVWDRAYYESGIGREYGHVAIVEGTVVENGEEYVIVSHAGVGTNPGPTTYPERSMNMKIPKKVLQNEHIYIVGP